MGRYFSLFAAVVFTAVAIPALSHPGRTDANGGHYNRKTGEYHYHNGGTARSAPAPSSTPAPAFTPSYLRPSTDNSNSPRPSRRSTGSTPRITPSADALVPQVPATIKSRVWHGTDGQQICEGTCEKLTPQSVTIVSPDGTQTVRALDELSAADRASAILRVEKGSEFHAAHREWTSSNGKYRVTAKALTTADDSVRIRAEDGRVIPVPLTKLSKEDLAYIQRLKLALETKIPEPADDNPFTATEDPFASAASFMGGSNASAFKTYEAPIRESSTARPFTPPAHSFSPAGASQGRDNATALTHWLNTETNVRHNSSCRWYANTKAGRKCSADEGSPCGQCGG